MIDNTPAFDWQLFKSYLCGALENLAKAYHMLVEYVHGYYQRYR